jgi:hypothetical protein
METIFQMKWPLPGVVGISIVLGILLSAIIIYIVYKYFEAKEQKRIHDYQLFLFQAKRKGLSSFQIKILRNMASHLKLSNPRVLTTDSSLFESGLSDFLEYLKGQPEVSENLTAIFRDLSMIYERLYIVTMGRMSLESMVELEDGEILYITTESGAIYLAKVAGRGGNFLALKLFIPAKNLRDFDNEQKVSLHVIRINDAEYLINTVTMGIDLGFLRVKISDDITKEKEFRHPYVNVVIPAYVTVLSPDGTTEPQKIEGSMVKLNDFECILRMPASLNFEKEYPVAFELNKFNFNVNSKIISSKTVEGENVYYLTFKFLDLSEAGKTVLTRFMAETV